MLRKIMAKTSFRETTRILLLSSDLDLASVMCLLIQAAAQRDDLICDGALGFVFLQTLQPKKFSCICSCDGGAEFSCERPKLKDWACEKTDPLQNHWKLDARRVKLKKQKLNPVCLKGSQHYSENEVLCTFQLSSQELWANKMEQLYIFSKAASVRRARCSVLPWCLCVPPGLNLLMVEVLLYIWIICSVSSTQIHLLPLTSLSSEQTGDEILAAPSMIFPWKKRPKYWKYFSNRTQRPP